jgi:hypothetical protein
MCKITIFFKIACISGLLLTGVFYSCNKADTPNSNGSNSEKSLNDILSIKNDTKHT